MTIAEQILAALAAAAGLAVGVIGALYYRRRRADSGDDKPACPVEDAPLPMLMIDGDGVIRAANNHIEQLFGYGPGELLGRSLECLIPTGSRERHVALRRDYAANPHPRPMSHRNLHGLHKNGSEIPIEVGLSTSIRDGSTRVLATVIDVSDKKHWERGLIEANQLMSSILHSAPFSIIATDVKGSIIAMSPAAERMLWYRQEELVGHATPELIHDPLEIARRAEELSAELGEPVQPGFDVFAAKARRGITESREWTYIRKDGSRLPVHLTVTALRSHENRLAGFLGIAYDITERKRADDYIRYLAHHDVLTGLPNRTLLQDRLNVAIERARRFGSHVGLMMVDLDHFKRINDSLGHHTGDQLLVVVAERLSACVRSSDTVARMGGDEFVIVLSDIHDLNHVRQLAEKIVADVSKPVAIGQHSLRVTPSIGVCLFPDDGDDAVVLLKSADMAMYEAKASGRFNVQIFSLTMAHSAAERLELEHALRNALELDQFELHFQPQVSLSTDSTIGVEALLRWQHPDKGTIAPGNFIAIAEDTGLIVPIGEWVLRAACRQGRQFEESLGRQLVISVNLSPRQLAQKNIVELVQAALRESGLHPTSLELEITENVLINHSDKVTQQLHRIRELGVRIAIDDFGTGFSSLAYITRFPIDRIKIDQSFVRNLTTDTNSEAVINAIIAMAHGLNIEVIAEGVETTAQRDYLRLRHCDSAQGYLYARPLPAAEALEQLDAQMETSIES